MFFGTVTVGIRGSDELYYVMKIVNELPKDRKILSEIFQGLEVEVPFCIEEAQEILRLQIEQLHDAIQYKEIGDTSIISVNGEIYIEAKWDMIGVMLDIKKEQFPCMGLIGTILTTIKILRGDDTDG
tara:strand:+ start:3712 stop:4092 length:381 start_codon:yes stop_codon:yes gene_type:complete